MRGRCPHEIICEILKNAKKEIRQTRLMYKANLSNQQLKRYLEMLEPKGFLVKTQKELWKTTKKGVRLIETFQRVCDLLGKEE